MQALKENGGRGRTKDLAPAVYKILKLSIQQINYEYPNNPGRRVLFERLATAQQDLKKRGIVKLEGGVWLLSVSQAEPLPKTKPQNSVGNINKLLEHLQNNLDKRGLQLEIIIKRFLELQGFKNIEATSKGPDGGIDLKAVKDDEWGSEDTFVIQVKNYAAKNKINNDIVASLRGRAAANHICWIITTSDFTSGAQKEAKSADGKAKMRLIKGVELAQLLIESDIELKHIYPT